MASFSTNHSLSQSDDYYFFHVSSCRNACITHMIDSCWLLILLLLKISKRLCSIFLRSATLETFLKEKTCFKGLNNLSFIALFFPNRPRCFQNTTGFSTGLSNFHKMAWKHFSVKDLQKKYL